MFIGLSVLKLLAFEVAKIKSKMQFWAKIYISPTLNVELNNNNNNNI